MECDFTEAVRWAEMLGFKRDGRMPAFGFGGEDHYLYSRTFPMGRLN